VPLVPQSEALSPQSAALSPQSAVTNKNLSRASL